MERLVSLISGGGSTMEQIGLAIERGGIPDMQLAGVISSKADAGGVQKARALGIEPIVVDPREFRSQALGGKIDREAFGHRLLRVLREDLGATVVTQNGWIPHTPPRVTEAYAGRIFNQHPGEPGMFGGKGMAGKAVHVAVLKFQELVGRVFPTAVVAHRATAGLDEGAVVHRRMVDVLPGDTPATLQERALPIEHIVQVEMLNLFMRGLLRDLEPTLVLPEESYFLEQAKLFAREHPEG